MAKKLKVTFWGGVGTVTGANFLVEGEYSAFIVDCGLLQGVLQSGEENSADFQYNLGSIDYLFVTHAHMDHIGKIPKLFKGGFSGVVFSTPETKELARVMLTDALKIMVQNQQQRNEVPLYEQEDLDKALSHWRTISYHVQTKINDEFSVYLKDAGHILGSAMYEFSYGSKKIVFTGDSGNSPTPLLKDTEKITDADYVIMDSVYGDRNHESKEERDARFQHILIEGIRAGGAIVIPAFSVERTQVILYELNNLVEDKKIPSVPVFLDSPLALKVTDIYKRTTTDFNAGVQNEIKHGDDIFSFPKLQIVRTSQESKSLVDTPNPKIIIAGSGMSAGGRVIHHEMNYLPDPQSTLLLMGYQAVGTLGRAIQEKPKELIIQGVHIPVRARIEMISGYSSHKDCDHLIDMIADTAHTVKKVFVVMGEPKASLFLVQRLRDYLDVDALYPERGKVYELPC
jgi:metallo-beta-lactamase family protein